MKIKNEDSSKSESEEFKSEPTSAAKLNRWETPL